MTKPIFKKLTLRLRPVIYERLRDVSFSSHSRPAEIARNLVTNSLMAGKLANLPAPAPPITESMSDFQKNLLRIAHASISNLSQLSAYARNSTQLDRLSGPGAPLDWLSEQLRAIGVKVEDGSISDGQAKKYLDLLTIPADRINHLVHALNTESASVPLIEWHGALSELTNGLK